MRLSWRIAVHAPLGFAAGLPNLLRSTTLTTWLTAQGLDLTTIGLFSLASLPANFKFLWAPLFDRWPSRWPDARRGWLLLFQLLLVAGIAGLGATAVSDLRLVALFACAVAFFSASHDVVLDAYRTEQLIGREVAGGSAAYVAGYRIAMIVAGGLAVALSAVVPWSVLYRGMAGLMAVGLVATLAAPTQRVPVPAKSFREAVAQPLSDLLSRPHIGWALAFLLFYKFADAVAQSMMNPFLLKSGFEAPTIGVAQGILGMAATVIGALIGGALITRLSLKRALFSFGLAQAFGNLGYVVLAAFGGGIPVLAVAIAADNLLNGLGTAALVAYITTLCHRRHSLFQYALMTAATSLLAHLLGAGAGRAAQALGWPTFFAGSTLIGLAALPLIGRIPLAAPAE